VGEWVRGWAFTGFPWLASGYSQSPPSPLAGFAPVFGVFGVGGLLAAVAALAVAAIGTRNWRPALLALLLAAGGRAAPGRLDRPGGRAGAVALLQPNIEQSLKWRPEMLQHWLEVNLSMLRSNPAQLVVLPETTIPLLIDHLPPDYRDALARTAAQHGGDVILGTFTRDADGHIFNAAVSLGARPRRTTPSSTWCPSASIRRRCSAGSTRWRTSPWPTRPAGARQPPMALAGQKVAVNICYEDVFGEELIRSLPEATLMLNLSNLAWYGDSLAQPQHLQIARLRALETGRPMLRATNTGMTALVMPDGRVEAVLPAFEAGALHVAVRGYQGLTPYARWGNWPAVAAALAVLGLAALRRR
jgi:apolipoprotein N-acyltransferase